MSDEGGTVESYVTKTGKVLTDADIEALADEAERGYDVTALARKPNLAKCPDCGDFWSEHDAWECQKEDGCLRIDRHRRYDKASHTAVPDEAVYPHTGRPQGGDDA